MVIGISCAPVFVAHGSALPMQLASSCSRCGGGARVFHAASRSRTQHMTTPIIVIHRWNA